MTAYDRIRKTITTNGNSLAVNLTQELKRMGLRKNDEVLVSLERVSGSRDNRFTGLEALEQLLAGYVLRCDEINSRIAYDPMKISSTIESGAFAMSCLEPTDEIPKDVWVSDCPDIIQFLFTHSWAIETVNVNAINYNTRAYRALMREAIRIAGKEKGKDFEYVCDIMYKLNDMGWQYDGKIDHGYIPNTLGEKKDGN